MIKLLKLLGILPSFAIFAMLIACSDDDPLPVENARFAMMITTDATNQTGLLVPLDTLGGTIDVGSISNAVSIGRTTVTGIAFGDAVYNIYNGAGEVGIAKYKLQEDGFFTNEGFIVGDNLSRVFAIASETEGFYINVGLDDKAIQKFNPTTFERTGSIDISSAIDPILATNKVDFVRYGAMLVSNGKLFTEVEFREEVGQLGQNPFDSVFVAIVDIASEQVDGMAILEGEAFSISTAPNYRYYTAAESGDAYFATTGLIGFDFTTFGGHIVRIKAGETDFDENWEINLDGTGLLINGPAFLNGKLYSQQSGEPLKSDFSNEFVLYETDVTTQENRPIAGFPASREILGIGPFAFEGKIYAGVRNADFDGYYSYDPSSREVEKVIEVVGGFPTELFVLR